MARNALKLLGLATLLAPDRVLHYLRSTSFRLWPRLGVEPQLGAENTTGPGEPMYAEFVETVYPVARLEQPVRYRGFTFRTGKPLIALVDHDSGKRHVLRPKGRKPLAEVPGCVWSTTTRMECSIAQFHPGASSVAASRVKGPAAYKLELETSRAFGPIAFCFRGRGRT